jgi:DNA-binding CsgD family transcriptional regulator/Ca2+-binding EF-hand superfamily protein
MRAALARLTANEKECLRRRLLHQTAKEMALDLGISPHAVEKRLKMARTKLGLSSSFEAARLLAEAEGAQRTVPHAPDLAGDVIQRQKRPTKPVVIGGIVMSMFAAGLIVLAAQAPGGVAPLDTGGVAPAPPEYFSASASPEQVEVYVKDSFARFERDGSGFVERSEGPASITLGCCGAPNSEADGKRTVLTGEPAWQRFLSDNGDDGDGKVSYAEFRAARYDQLLKNGIPVRRDQVKMVGERPSPYREAKPGASPVRVSAEDLDYVKASPERVRAYVRQMFDGMDADRSGFIEAAEAPAMLITAPAKMGADGKATYDPSDPGIALKGDAARKQYIANVDKDGDGKVSFEEFAEPVMPQFLRRGIPLIPADWTPSAPGRK